MKGVTHYHFYDFNVYSALLLCPFITGLVFVVLCFVRYRKQEELSMLFLALLLVMLIVRLSFWMLGFAGWYDRHDVLTTFMFYFPFNTLPLIGPCLYFYFLSVTNQHFKPSRKQWPHLVIPVLLIILYLVKFAIDFLIYRPFPVSESFQYGTRGPLAELDKSIAIYVIAYMALCYYFVIVLRALKNYENYLTENFAETGGIDLKWLKRMIWFTITATILLFCFYLVNIFTKMNYILNWYPYLFLGALIYYISINGYLNSAVLFRRINFQVAESSDTAKASIFSDLELWKQNLAALMEQEKPFLDPAVSLSSLASRLGINSAVLSRVINEGFGQNFNDYINGWRVAAVLKLLHNQSHKKYSMMGIAWDCGFNSKATFNRSFKKVTGKTPSDYIKTIPPVKRNHDY